MKACRIPLSHHTIAGNAGHQTSQTFFVLKYLIGYQNAFWCDAGWTEWSARKELPVASGLKK